jgi:hypothetical protein
VLGRWLSRDPIGEDGGVNLYAFVGNDGVNGWDHLGQRNYFTVIAGDSKTWANESGYKGWKVWALQNGLEATGHTNIGYKQVGRGGARLAESPSIAPDIAALNLDTHISSKCDALVMVYWIGQNDITDEIKTLFYSASSAAGNVFSDWNTQLDALVTKVQVMSRPIDTLLLVLNMDSVQTAPRNEWQDDSPPWNDFWAKRHWETAQIMNASIAGVSKDLSSITKDSKYALINVSNVRNWVDDGGHHTDAGNAIITGKIYGAIQTWLDSLGQ